MRIKKGFILRTVCGENVIVGEGLDAINFGRMLCPISMYGSLI